MQYSLNASSMNQLSVEVSSPCRRACVAEYEIGGQCHLLMQHAVVSHLLHQQVHGVLAHFPERLAYRCQSGLAGRGDVIVAYYGEVIRGNQDLEGIPLALPYLSLENPKVFAKRIADTFSLDKKEVFKATKKAFAELELYHKKVIAKGEKIMEKARKEGRHIIVLSGRPYHVDPEINHGIDRMIVSLGASVISEDSVAPLTGKGQDNVLNQWTYHARMYDAARYIADQRDMNLVQLVSFGCGLDAVTTDEVKEILREKDRIYTQIKIDEITNLGAVRIRMRSLFAAIEMEEEKYNG